MYVFSQFFFPLRYALTTFDLLASLQCLLGREDARTAVTALLVKTGLKQLFFSLFCVDFADSLYSTTLLYVVDDSVKS